jgi:predicted RecA/RadA family phage recombinase
VAYGNGLFVAVSTTGIGNRVMTSPDGITWTSRTSAADNSWNCVAFGNGLFVAVASTGTGDRVMTSPDGITWTARTSAADNLWASVAYGNGRFVAASTDGTGNRVMTSTNGVSWTTSQTPNERWNTQNSTNADPERSAATAPGTLQASDFQSHAHTMALAGAHTHAFDRRANAFFGENSGSNNDTSVKSTSQGVIGSSTTSTDGTHTHTMNANSDGGNANETRPVNLNLWVYIRIK